MFIKKIALAGAVSLFASGAAVACSYENTVPLKSLTAGFEAWKAVTDAMAACGNFEPELDQEFRTKQPAAFAANPSLYHIGGVSNGTVTPLLNEGTIRPLDDLVAKYGQNLSPNQLIRVDGQIMAIAMMVNTQHMMYRSDIFADLGLEAPATYDDVLAAAQAIKDAGVVEYPIGATMKTGWDLATDFTNMYFGFGGTLYGDDSMPMVNSEAGLKTLEMMQKLTAYMDPEFLVSNSTYVQQQFQQGKIAMANLWASRGGAMNDAAESTVVGKVAASAAPLAMEGGAPATTLWWDGIVIAANITDEEADAAFRLAMQGLTTEVVQANNDAAIWLIEGYQPSDMASGAIATATASPAPSPFPSATQMGLMHSALGNALSGFFTGEMSAEDTLAAVEDAYKTAAEEAGLL